MASLRSTHWFGLPDKDGFIHRSWMKNQGFPPHLFDGRPVIGICNTFSELVPCNAHFRQIAERVKRGVYEAGGFPLEFPVMSLGETNLRPTAMLFRNLVSMDVEESIRGNPIDGVVLLCGCDKTTPSLVMGAASCIFPARTSSLICQTPVPEPIGWPRKFPLSIGPPETTMAGRSQLAAPITSDGVVLSHPHSRTTPSTGLPRMDSSTSMLTRFLKSIAVGRMLVSPNDITGNSRGTPPASQTPRFTYSAIWRK